MKNLMRRLFGRFYFVRHSNVLLYKGSWLKGSFHGYGILKRKSGGVYEGNFRFGVKHGLGVFKSSSGFQYAGEWINGEQTGSAKIVYKNGDWYNGSVKNGVRYGLGELFEKSSQRIFKGQWLDGTLAGEVQITSTGWKFSGPLPNQQGRTLGTIIYSDGSSYVGELLKFSRFGFGELTSKSGSQISGSWLDDTTVNSATINDDQGIQWYGALENLKPHGFMKVLLPNGQNYDGVWLNGDLQRVLSVRNKMNVEPVYRVH
jgi:hypothetical protein